MARANTYLRRGAMLAGAGVGLLVVALVVVVAFRGPAWLRYNTTVAVGGAPSLEFCDAGWLGNALRRECYVAAISERLIRSGADEVVEIDEFADKHGSLGAECHIYMHEAAPLYAKARAIQAGDLPAALPVSTEPNCASGLTHGLMTYLGDQLDEGESAGVLIDVCGRSDTPMKRLNCNHGLGHSFFRLSQGDISATLEQCDALGYEAVECGGGAFMEHWFNVNQQLDVIRGDFAYQGADRMCAGVGRQYVFSCWLRAIPQEAIHDGTSLTPEGLASRCGELAGDRRAGCFAGGAFGRTEPGKEREVFALCSAFAAADAISCVRGINYKYVDVKHVTHCELLPGSSVAACFDYFGQAYGLLHGAAMANRCANVAPPKYQGDCVAGVARRESFLGLF